jgi:SAM-dependent methyltransferase
MVYQTPLAYLLGLEGVALLRAFGGDYDREYCQARVEEIRRLLDSPLADAEAVLAEPVDTVGGYEVWSHTYDEPGNGLFGYEEPAVYGILDKLPAGVALDAACGTGRHSAHLAEHGHQVIGVDSSPDMLERARARVPGGTFLHGDLRALPLPDNHVDLVVCALALTHHRDLGPVLAEFARVLRPGGHLVISDLHEEQVLLGGVVRVRVDDGRPALLPAYRHRASDYLNPALSLGFTLRRCEEPRQRVDDLRAPMAQDTSPGPWDEWPWSLARITPGATAGAWEGVPVAVVWHFQLTA